MYIISLCTNSSSITKWIFFYSLSYYWGVTFLIPLLLANFYRIQSVSSNFSMLSGRGWSFRRS